MIIYVAFMSIDSKIKESITGFQKMSCPIDWEYDSNKDIWFGLYAYSDNKKLFKKFKKQRNNKIFVFKKYEVNDVEEFESQHHHFKLNSYEYRESRDSSEKIVSTEFESSSSYDEGLIFEIFFGDKGLPDPKILTYEANGILDNFGYTYTFFNYSSMDDSLPFSDNDDEDDFDDDSFHNRIDVFWNNYSYLDRNNWTYLNEKGQHSNVVHINELSAFIYLFGNTFE